MYVSMRPGALARLVAGVVVVSVLAIGLLMAGRPAGTSSNPASNPSNPVVSSLSARAAAEVRPLLFQIVRTSGYGLNIRHCPQSGCATVGWLPAGGSFAVLCSAVGVAVHGDTAWLAGAAGYAAGYYLDPAAGVDPVLVPTCDRLAAARG
ncbi:MAG TPA: hypothetical protein VF892_04285 [Pseudonocardiaceae bacterium]